MSQATKNKKSALYTTIEILLILTMTIVGNMWDWVNMSFRPEAITTSEFWESAGIKATLYTCCLVIGIMIKLQKLELKNPQYDDLYAQYRNHLPFKNKNKDLFQKYVDHTLNPNIKKEYIRTKLNRKLARIQKHERDTWLQDYFRAKECEDYKTYEFSGIFKGFFSKRYYKKRRRIEEMLEGDFIDKNWEYLHVRYPRISAAVFTYYLDVRRNRDDKWKVENETRKDVTKQGTLKAVQTVLMGIVVAVFALQPQANELLEQANGWIVLIIEYIIRVVMMVGSFVMGVLTAKRVFNENFLLPLTNRIDILEDFEFWVDKNPVKEMGVQTLTDQIKKELTSEYENKFEQRKKELELKYAELVKEQGRNNDTGGAIV